jgi:hypothetical protein
MSEPETPPPSSAARVLPAHPSAEYLRKEAKKLGKERSVTVSEAQRVLAFEYGEASWAALMARVRELRGEPPLVPTRNHS